MEISSVPIQVKNQYALKEWAVILNALSEGRQFLLFRKGGISENKRKFRIEHQEFFIYPTYHHQQRKGIRPDYLKRFGESCHDPSPPGHVCISHYAQIQSDYHLSTLELLTPLNAFHVLTFEELKKRFYYGKNPGLAVLLVRLYKLPTPFVIPVLPRYQGCKSWVKLDQYYSTRNSSPVLDKNIFTDKRFQIEAILGRSNNSVES